ncbi:glycosyltransferase [Rhodococcus hoagii]|nr:glycosyltransferase [Prescottella equi]
MTKSRKGDSSSNRADRNRLDASQNRIPASAGADPYPSVSVVVPTTGRASLSRAIESALRQTAVEVEVIVVMNGVGSLPSMPIDSRVSVITNRPGSGANQARNTGICASSAEYVALLDDDDYWHPDKLRKQFDFARLLGLGEELFVVGCRVSGTSFDCLSDVRPKVAPPSPLDDIESYLFLREGLRSNLPQLQSSTLLFPRAVAMRTGFDSQLTIHQDWQWLLQVVRSSAVPVLLHPEVLAVCEKNMAGTMTSRSKWTDSLRWADEFLGEPSPTYCDFVLGVPLRFALRSGSVVGVASCIKRGFRVRRASPAAMMYATALSLKFFADRTVSLTSGSARAAKRFAKRRSGPLRRMVSTERGLKCDG